MLCRYNLKNALKNSNNFKIRSHSSNNKVSQKFQKLNASEFASTVKAPLQKCYLECLEFLIFRALPVIMSDELQQRVDIVQSNIIAIATVCVLVKIGQVRIFFFDFQIFEKFSIFELLKVIFQIL